MRRAVSGTQLYNLTAIAGWPVAFVAIIRQLGEEPKISAMLIATSLIRGLVLNYTPESQSTVGVLLCKIAWSPKGGSQRVLPLLLDGVRFPCQPALDQFLLGAKWVWVKIKPPGVTQVLVHVATYQGSILGLPYV